MGLIPQQEVSPVGIVRPADGTLDCYQNYDGMFHVDGKLEEYSIAEIVAEYGERVPTYEQSQKDFKIQFALVVHEDSTITQNTADSFMKYIDDFEKHTPYLLSNKATITVIPYE
jgi:hypothetical protein